MESYFSSFYSYNFPKPENPISSGEYDIGCGGACDWYITKDKIEADNFCIPRLNGRYAFILDLYCEHDFDCDLYTNFKKLFPSVVEGNDLTYIAFGDSSSITGEMVLSVDGYIIVADLESDRSTYMFDEKSGAPVWDGARIASHNSVDEATWKRVKIIPFESKF